MHEMKYPKQESGTQKMPTGWQLVCNQITPIASP